MKETDDGYHISLFKPTTERARFNRNLVFWLASIWFIAIFGFQIALRVFEKPTPQASYTMFTEVWNDVSRETASAAQMQDFSYATLSVLGKIAVKPDERAVLDNALSHAIYLLHADSVRDSFVEQVSKFEAVKAGIKTISDEDYLMGKKQLTAYLAPMLGLKETDPRRDILPTELTAKNIANFSETTVAEIPGIMEKYLVHNQSFLTDARILGFPFHYFYTAVFLLILFVGLCWVYCVRTDRRDLKLGIEE